MWRQILAAGGILITFSGAADAADCASIAEPAARLACYDRLNAPAASPATAEPATPLTEAAPKPTTPAVEPEQQFGAETLPAKAGDPATPEAIESRISGPFKGWTKNSEFRLDNGQVWRCHNCRDVYYQAENPAVTVKRGFMGNYWLQVEGLNTRATVKRIQ